MKRQEISLLLFEKVKIVQPYPPGVVPVDKMIDITAFFPGGKGLWSEEHSDIMPNILVLGQDFSTLDDYKKILRNQSADLGCPTWRNLIKLFDEVSIDLKQCFFSNVFMGLRKEGSLTGKFPGARDKEFVRRNLEFLLFQIDSIRPKIIITLGRPASEMVAKISDTLNHEWDKGKALSVPYNGIKRGVTVGTHVTTLVALEHTSMRNQNVKRRMYKNDTGEYSGHQAEVEMLKDAVKQII